LIVAEISNHDCGSVMFNCNQIIDNHVSGNYRNSTGLKQLKINYEFCFSSH